MHSMEQSLVTAALWIAFGGTHVGLSMRPVRKRLVGWLGEDGYIFFYAAVALGTFGALVHFVALHRFDEPQASLLTSIPPVRGALIALSVFGFSLFVAAVIRYPGLPMAVFRHRTLPVRGIQRITRHPFFSGIAIWAAAHAFLSPSRVSFAFFLGMVVFSIVGALHQDRRLVEELGEPYRGYVAATSFWPFVAIATKRQKMTWREQPWVAYALGVVVSVGLYEVHDRIFDHGGAYVIGAVSLGSILALLGARARAKRGLEG